MKEDKMEEDLLALELYAKENKIPIMLPDGITYLCHYIATHHIKHILEIGSAIGYSAIKMALVSPDIYITTIEKDPNRFLLALDNIKKFKLTDRIHLLLGDAKDQSISQMYDLIFIDASKSNNILFFKKYCHNLKPSGIIVTDNLFFHGLVLNDELIQTKNQAKIVQKIREFKTFLDTHPEFITKYISVGDGLAVSTRRR